MSHHTPGPWTWRNVSGAGLQISAVLPAGFKFDGTAREWDGKTSLMIWTVREAYTVQIADERWVQFSTGSWDEMQKANASLIAAAPKMLAALQRLASDANFNTADHMTGCGCCVCEAHTAIAEAVGEN